MIWFTADWHLEHKAIMKHCPERQCFNTLDDMNTGIIDTLNKYVQKNDILYHLGDFCWQASKVGKFRAKINCRTIHVVQGNHDSGSLKKHVSSFAQMMFLKKLKIHLCHYPLESWLWMHYNGKHLHGHCHGRLKETKNRMDVGIDMAYKLTGEWRPFNLDEILFIFEK
jgi:calcineurin-like phosphoesterase family protein